LVVKTTEGASPVSSKFVQTLDLVRGPQNGVPYYTRTFDKLPVAVAEAVPFSITIDQPKVPIVRNGSMKLKIRAVRKDGYDKRITVRFPWLPPGVSSPATMIFDEKATEIDYELNANENAEVNKWGLTVLAESDAGKGVMYNASPFISLSVEEPYVGVKLTMTSAKQGETVEMLAEVEHLREFKGEGEVQLFGLPAHSTAESKLLKPGAETLAFPIVTTEKTPVGQHKGVFCTVTLMHDGEPIVHRLAMGSVFRVDPKPKEVAAAPAPAAKSAAPAEKKEKPLSRLEQLRLEAQKGKATP
jgi:hypothetical protein